MPSYKCEHPMRHVVSNISDREHSCIKRPCLYFLQVEMQVKIVCGSEPHRGDMKLPIREVSVDGGKEKWDGDVSLVLGPLCFL